MMMKNILLTITTLFLFLISSVAQDNSKQTKRIILLIGDGMGATQVYAGWTANKGKLQLERSKYIGFSKTYSKDNYITDSGAGGTAISCGKKTKNYSVGVDYFGKPMKTILEYAEDAGLATGLVATSSITHATPASFIAHNVDRGQNEAIAEDFLKTDIDIFIGGGRVYFEQRSDSINLSDSLKDKGYEIYFDINKLKPSKKSNIGCFVAYGHPVPVDSGRGDYLVKATQKAMKKLNQNPAGSFLMVEGSQIDWGGHANSTQYIASEVIDFDQAVGAAFDYADKNPGTLVVVTADHETGGFAIQNGNFQTGQVQGAFASTGHTGVMVPVFAYGEGAEAFAGIYENTELFYKMMQFLGLQAE